MRGMSGGIKTKSNSEYVVTLYELLKSYSSYAMRKNFMSINIPKLPVCTPDQAILIIKKNIKNLSDWNDISKLIPGKFKESKKLRRTGLAGFFAATLELAKEGLLVIMQKKEFGALLVKEKK